MLQPFALMVSYLVITFTIPAACIGPASTARATITPRSLESGAPKAQPYHPVVVGNRTSPIVKSKSKIKVGKKE